MTLNRYDIIHKADGHMTIEPHFCREIDCNGVGCYGTNLDHGFTLEEACEHISGYYIDLARLWMTLEHPDVKYYIDN